MWQEFTVSYTEGIDKITLLMSSIITFQSCGENSTSIRLKTRECIDIDINYSKFKTIFFDWQRIHTFEDTHDFP